MTAQHLLQDATYLKSLAERLSACPEVTRLDKGEEKEAWTIAHSFADLEGSFRKFLDEQLPKLMNGELPAADTYSLLLEIGEELRHILYHIRDPKFYRYLHDEVKEATG